MLEALRNLLLPWAEHPSVAASVIIIFATIWFWVLIWKLKFKWISLWISAVMFAWIFFWHLGYHINPEVWEFLRDFWLILFVYVIGLQVWPYFFQSLKSVWIKFNALAIITVFLWWGLTLLLAKASGIWIDNFSWIMSWAVTNTPGLWAAKATLQDISKASWQIFSDPMNWYALTYPFWVLWAIFVMILWKSLFKIDAKKEEENFFIESEKSNPSPKKTVIRLSNENMIGKSVWEIVKMFPHGDMSISRLKRSWSSEVIIPHRDTILQNRDVLMIIWSEKDTNYLTNLLWRVSTDQLIVQDPGTRISKIIVTEENIQFKTIAQLKLEDKYNVKITRVDRWEIQFLASWTTQLMIWDVLTVIWRQENVDQLEKVLWNVEKKLQEPELMTLCIWIILWVIIWSLPIVLPWLAYPLKIWLAAWPLIIALFLSKYAIKFKISPYLPKAAQTMTKELGISLFFAVAWLKAWSTFWKTFVEQNGLIWIGYWILITCVPLILMMIYARVVMKINFLQLAGLMAATYTDPAALAFANNYFKSTVPSQSYAIVYPLVSIFRILVAQLVILLMIK